MLVLGDRDGIVWTTVLGDRDGMAWMGEGGIGERRLGEREGLACLRADGIGTGDGILRKVGFRGGEDESGSRGYVGRRYSRAYRSCFGHRALQNL